MIPKLHYISQGNTPKDHLEHITKACSSGIELVQLRLINLDESTVLKIAEQAREITSNYQTRLILTDHYKIAKTVKADGVHLENSNDTLELIKKHLYSWQIVGGSANTLKDCELLADKNIDYIGLGPFRLTKTKQNLNPVIGYDGYNNIMNAHTIETPIIAVGGITLNDVSELLKTGIYGIAASQELTSDFNKISLFHKLLQTDAQQEQIWNPNQTE